MWVIDLQKSGTVPGVGMIHAPFSLMPVPFPEDHFREACELAPIFNELFDRVSLDAKFLQDSLSRFVFAILTIWYFGCCTLPNFRLCRQFIVSLCLQLYRFTFSSIDKWCRKLESLKR